VKSRKPRLHNEPAHTDDGSLTAAVEFDYDVLERNVFPGGPVDVDETGYERILQAAAPALNLLPAPDRERITQELRKVCSVEIVDAASKLFQMFMRWNWQDGKKNPEGLQIRSMISCWLFIPELRALTETELAIGFGKKKQSIERWVDEWKQDFPRIRNAHMRPL
jgi:hypothetical protein